MSPQVVNDISLSTILITVAIAVGGWLLRETGKAIVKVITKLIETLLQTMADVKTLDSKLKDLINAVGDVQKIRNDLNQYYKRLKTLEDEFENQKQL